MEEHSAGEGAVFTSKHRPIRLKCLWEIGEMSYEEAEAIEDEFTKLLIKRWGKTVRGGRWANKLSDRVYGSIIKEKNTFSPSSVYKEITLEYSFGGEEKPLKNLQKYKTNLQTKRKQNQTKKIKSRKASKHKHKSERKGAEKGQGKSRGVHSPIKKIKKTGYRIKL